MDVIADDKLLIWEGVSFVGLTYLEAPWWSYYLVHNLWIGYAVTRYPKEIPYYDRYLPRLVLFWLSPWRINLLSQDNLTKIVYEGGEPTWESVSSEIRIDGEGLSTTDHGGIYRVQKLNNVKIIPVVQTWYQRWLIPKKFLEEQNSAVNHVFNTRSSLTVNEI